MRYALHQMGLLPGSRPSSLRRNADPREHRHMKGDGSWWVNDAQGIPLVRVCEECEEAQLSRFRPEIVMGYTQEDVDEPIDPEPNPIDPMQERWDDANYAVRVAERANDYKGLERAKAEVRRIYQEMQDARSRRAMGRNPKRTSRRLDPNACPSCGGVSHPASGSVLPSGEVVCGPCVRRFWGWASEHGEKRYRVGPKGKGAEYIPFPTGITKPKPTKPNSRRTSKRRTSRSRP